MEWYLSIDVKRDVIERPVQDGLDISGWDLKKALRLFVNQALSGTATNYQRNYGEKN